MSMSWLPLAALMLERLEWAVLAYFLLANSVYAVLLLSAAWEMLWHARQVRGEDHWRMLGSRVAPRISMLAPAYNEAATIRESVQALLALYYPNLEVVVVNDGSQDATLTVLQESFELVPIHPIYRRQIDTKPVGGLYRSRKHPGLLVVDKANGGKADALNAGLQLASGELFCAMDADTLIEPDALLRMVRPFLMRDDVLSAGGTVRVVNGSQVQGGRVVIPCMPRRILAGFQVVEYLRAFLFGRLGWNRLGGNLIISGAFGLFRREAVIAAGGYAHDTVGEDMELVLRLRRHGYETRGPHRVAFIPDPVAWTEVPESLQVLGRQRDRWHRGLADSLWRHRRVLLNPRYGMMGLVTYPYFFFVELLAPVAEALGLLGLAVGLSLGILDVSFAVLFFLVAYGYGLLLTTFTLVLEELSFHRYAGLRDRLLLVAWALLENLGYRQLTVFWRLRGLGKFWGGRTDWGVMERRGFQQVAGRGQQTTGHGKLPVLLLGIALASLHLGIALTSAEEITLQQPVPPAVQEIELVYVDGRPPTVSLKAAVASPTSPSRRPTGMTVDLLALLAEVRAFGGCEVQTERMPGHLTLHLRPSGTPPCGAILWLPSQGGVVDVLSYDTLQLHGKATGRMTLALVDETAWHREDNVPLTTVTGRFDLRVPLGPAAQRLDLRRLVALAVVPETADARLEFEVLTLEQTAAPRQTVPGLGFWVWEYRQALANPLATLESCQRQGCRRLLVQMPALEDPETLWSAYGQFLRAAQDRGIETFALDGYPEAIHTPAPLFDKVRRLLGLMAGHRLAGVQLDIEPYLLEDFFVDDTGFVRYLAVIEQMREALAGQARLSIVMPFWLTSQMLHGRSVAFAVLDRADEVAVMSYRTDMNELRAIAEDTLRYGDMVGIPVWLAVETVPLPLERHVVLKREVRREVANAYLDHTRQRLVLKPPPPVEGLAWWRVHRRTTVRPERLTFAGRTRQEVRAAIGTLVSTVAHPSFAGILIHDFNGFQALSD